MDTLLGLLSLAGLSLFLARFLKLPTALAPLLAVGGCMLWFTLLGALGLLIPAGWLWYLLCAAALLWVLLREKKQVLALLDTGFLFFVVAGALFCVLFFATQPMFTEWDDFTVWGASSKVCFETGQLYTTAHSNLLAKAQPPALILMGYMVQFFGGTFAEYKVMAGYALVYLAAFSAASAVFAKRRSAALCLLCGFLLLPFFFEAGTGQGQQSMAYLSVLADGPLAAMFGGILCFYFAAPAKDTRALLPFCLLLAALTSMKEMGFALALIALVIAAADLFFCERDRLRFVRLARWKGALVFLLAGGLCVVLAYGGWALHLSLVQDTNRFNLGSGGSNLYMDTLLLTALKAFFGLEQHPQYSAVLPKMLAALREVPVSLAGPGLLLFAGIAAVLLAAFFCAGTGRQRRRATVFLVVSTLGFAAYYIFHLFLYAFIFKEVEALILKDYLRYISTYWQGWLMAAVVLLALAAESGQERRLKMLAARTGCALVSVAIVGVVALRGNWQANVLLFSPSNYSTRLDVQAVTREAEAQGMRRGDVVYLLSQGDPGDRAYKFRYEMAAQQVPQYGGIAYGEDGKPLRDDDGNIQRLGNVGTSLVPKKGFIPSYYTYTVVSTPKDLAAYLKEQKCTHFFIDQLDAHFLKVYSPLFSDRLRGWSDTEPFATGHRYYRIEWEGDTCRMVPEEGGARA